MGRWTLALKSREVAPTKETPDRTSVIALLDLARVRNWSTQLIVGGGWRESAHGERKLILGEVVGGSEAKWRAFADRATDTQMAEATWLLLALSSAA